MDSRQVTKALKGRTIKEVRLRPFRDGRGGWATNPLIIFEDGSHLFFEVQETETDYGVQLFGVMGGKAFDSSKRVF